MTEDLLCYCVCVSESGAPGPAVFSRSGGHPHPHTELHCAKSEYGCVCMCTLGGTCMFTTWWCGVFDDSRHTHISHPHHTQLMHASLQCLASIVHENRVSA